MPLEPQACDSVEHNCASCRMSQPAPPNSRGTGADSTPASRSAVTDSMGKRDFASTSGACLAAISVAMRRVASSRDAKSCPVRVVGAFMSWCSPALNPMGWYPDSTTRILACASACSQLLSANDGSLIQVVEVLTSADAAHATVVLLHGYSMTPSDLSPFASSLGVAARFVFPEGPVDTP